MLTLKSILLFSQHPDKLAAFYEKVLKIKPDWQEGKWTGFTLGTGGFAIGPHDKVKGKNKTPERMMFNLETNDVEGEFARIEKLGVTVITKPYHPMEEESMWVATFEDPDGNYFQLMSPMK